MNPRKLQRKLAAYIKYKDLTKSIKMVALSQLTNLKKNISTRGIPLSSIIPFFNKKNYNTDFNSCLVVAIGVDKSCCGPHNANIYKYADSLVNTLLDTQKTVSVITISNRIKYHMKRYQLNSYIGNVANVDKEPLSLAIVFSIAEYILNNQVDRYYLVFNRYYTPFTQKTNSYEIPGFSDYYNILLNIKSIRELNTNEDFFGFLLKIDALFLNDVVKDIFFYSFAYLLLDSLEENEYSSLGARVTAMDNSTQNAAKLIDVLRLQYNKARQSAITNELIEIVSAANIV